MKTAIAQTGEPGLTPLQRRAGLLITGAMLVLFGFLAAHQFMHTGFFTFAFGPVEMFCLYGPILVSLAPPVIRALSGRQNLARPFDAATSLFLALGSLWLLIVFPFDFTHLADVLPGVIRFLLSWFADDLGRALLILQVIICPILALVTITKYFTVRRSELALDSFRQTV